jgi:hypothetical protein
LRQEVPKDLFSEKRFFANFFSPEKSFFLYIFSPFAQLKTCANVLKISAKFRFF